jgi:hypothetical protein
MKYMAWRIVNQPNGKLAIFSDVIDKFTFFSISVDEAIMFCAEKMGTLEAKNKVQSGIDDIEPWTSNKKGDGLSRWKDCLNSIVMVHGYEGLKETLQKMELENYLPPIEEFKEYLHEE